MFKFDKICTSKNQDQMRLYNGSFVLRKFITIPYFRCFSGNSQKHFRTANLSEYSEHFQKSEIGRFAKIVNGFQPLISDF